MVIATARPLSPAAFTMMEGMLGGPIRLVLSSRGSVANLINRGYERRQDLVTEIVEEMPLDQRAIASAAGAAGQSTDSLQLARQTRHPPRCQHDPVRGAASACEQYPRSSNGDETRHPLPHRRHLARCVQPASVLAAGDQFFAH